MPSGEKKSFFIVYLFKNSDMPPFSQWGKYGAVAHFCASLETEMLLGNLFDFCICCTIYMPLFLKDKKKTQ